MARAGECSASLIEAFRPSYPPDLEEENQSSIVVPCVWSFQVNPFDLETFRNTKADAVFGGTRNATRFSILAL